MTRCELSIEFYRPDKVFRTGEPVEGWVRATVDRNVRCDGLNLVARWEVQGEGSPSRKNYHIETIFRGEWRAGEQYEYSFRFTPPAEPLSWTGRNLSVAHFVAIHTELPWSPPTRCEESFCWLPGRQSPERNGRHAEGQFVLPAGRRVTLMELLPGAIAAIAAVAGLTMLAWSPVAGAIVLLIAAGMALISLRGPLSRMFTGAVAWHFPQTAVPGELIDSRVEIRPRHTASIRQAQMTLTGTEIATRRREKSRSEFRHEFFRQVYPVSGKVRAAAGRPLVLEFTFSFPETGAWSLDLPDNQVQWTATLEIVPYWRWPLWSLSRTIVVAPSLRSAMLSETSAASAISATTPEKQGS